MEIVYPKQNSQSSIRCFDKRTSLFPLSRRSRPGASIARGSPRTIGQKPEPTIRRGMTRKSLPPGGRGTTKWWKEPAWLSACVDYIVARSPSVAYGDSSLPEGAFRIFPPIENTTKEKSLVVFVFSPLNMRM